MVMSLLTQAAGWAWARWVRSPPRGLRQLRLLPRSTRQRLACLEAILREATCQARFDTCERRGTGARLEPRPCGERGIERT